MDYSSPFRLVSAAAHKGDLSFASGWQTGAKALLCPLFGRLRKEWALYSYSLYSWRQIFLITRTVHAADGLRVLRANLILVGGRTRAEAAVRHKEAAKNPTMVSQEIVPRKG